MTTKSERLANALNAADPRYALEKEICELRYSGLTDAEIVEALTELLEQKRSYKEAKFDELLEEMLDRVSGWCAPAVKL